MRAFDPEKAYLIALITAVVFVVLFGIFGMFMSAKQGRAAHQRCESLNGDLVRTRTGLVCLKKGTVL